MDATHFPSCWDRTKWTPSFCIPASEIFPLAVRCWLEFSMVWHGKVHAFASKKVAVLDAFHNKSIHHNLQSQSQSHKMTGPHPEQATVGLWTLSDSLAPVSNLPSATGPEGAKALRRAGLQDLCFEFKRSRWSFARSRDYWTSAFGMVGIKACLNVGFLRNLVYKFASCQLLQGCKKWCKQFILRLMTSDSPAPRVFRARCSCCSSLESPEAQGLLGAFAIARSQTGPREVNWPDGLPRFASFGTPMAAPLDAQEPEKCSLIAAAIFLGTAQEPNCLSL